MSEGKHILYVEVKKDQAGLLGAIIDEHPKLLKAGVEESSSGLLIDAENSAKDFVKWAP